MDELQDPIELVIFDCDGVLVNSLPVLNRVLSAALAASGLDMGVDEVSRRISGTADLAGVAILILGFATRAGATDEAVRQEHFFRFVVRLLDDLGIDVACFAQAIVDLAND